VRHGDDSEHWPLPVSTPGTVWSKNKKKNKLKTKKKIN
jgi:hypothetical protein